VTNQRLVRGADPKNQIRRLREVALLYLTLGTIAFGGPAAHIAMMEEEVVRRRQWLTREEFLDMLGASNLIPGPSSTELALHIGYRQAGLAGLLVGGCCFILPAAILVTAIAWAYVRFGHLPQVQSLLYGVKPVVIAIVVQALWRLGRTALKTPGLAMGGVAATALSFAGAPPLVILFGFGSLVALVREIEMRRLARSNVPMSVAMPATAPILATAVAHAVLPIGLGSLFLIFLKIGSIVFGSGYVLLAFLRADLVERLHWLSEGQLLDAVAVGQVTPGPVFTTATFIGYIVAGPRGAVVATVAIFLPGFVLVALSAPFVARLRRSKAAGAFLDGLNVASLALMAAVTWQLGRAALVDAATVGIAIACALLLLLARVNATWLVAGGAMIGLVVRWHG